MGECELLNSSISHRMPTFLEVTTLWQCYTSRSFPVRAFSHNPKTCSGCESQLHAVMAAASIDVALRWRRNLTSSRRPRSLRMPRHPRSYACIRETELPHHP